MKDVGVSPDKLGYKYSGFIINEILTNDPESMTTLYNKAAEEFNSTYVRVERCIRHCVECAFIHTDTDTLNKYFGNCITTKSGKVANGAFLYSIAEYIKAYILKENFS